MILYVAYFRTIDKKKEKEILQEHLDYVNKLYRDGAIVAKGPFTDKSGGLIIYQASSREEAEVLVSNDPVIKYGSRQVEFKEWRSTLEWTER